MNASLSLPYSRGVRRKGGGGGGEEGEKGSVLGAVLYHAPDSNSDRAIRAICSGRWTVVGRGDREDEKEARTCTRRKRHSWCT